jgi:type II secretory pathway component PulK
MDRPRKKRKGVVLLAVLVVLVVLTLAAYQFSELMTSEAMAANSYVQYSQAHACAEAGAIYAMGLLSDPNGRSGALNNNPFDNPIFQAHIVLPNENNPKLQGRFSIIAPTDPNDPTGGGNTTRSGLMDESGKININAMMQLDPSGTILYTLLMALPNMTDDVANAIIDWVDADDTPRGNGAESDYYGGLTPPYQAKNGPLDSIEELLFVRGVTPQLLYGNDTNRNGVLDPEEDDGSGMVNLGWAAYLTMYSREQNIDSSGKPRTYVNGSDLQGLYTQLNNALTPDMATYIIAYRMYGAYSPPGSGGGGAGGGGAGGGGAGGAGTGASGAGMGSSGAGSTASSSGANRGTPTGAATTAGTTAAGTAGRTTAVAGGAMAGAAGGAGGASTTPMPGPVASVAQTITNTISSGSGGNARSISSLYELIGTQVSVPSSVPNAPPTLISCPLNDPSQLATLLPTILDELTTVRGSELPARINVNTAPQAVLATLPGLSPADVSNILSTRPAPSAANLSDTTYQTPAWLITQANLNPKTLQSLDRYITGTSQVYRVQSIGYFDGGGPTARIEAVFDTNNGRPRILYWRDITELGKGINQQNSP